jgi:UDP-N-acetylmuramoylalanine--D-glutamate ligase
MGRTNRSNTLLDYRLYSCAYWTLYVEITMILCSNYRGKYVGVFGLGKSGQASYTSLKASGAEVVAWDDKATSTDALPLLHYSQWDWGRLDAVILSPGVPLTHPAPHEVVQLAKRHHVRITCDISLLMEAQPEATYIGITGTNGKSTTTALIAHCLTSLGASVACGGNIGTPALSIQALGKGAYYVLELSSYQLDLMDAGVINIACFLNITPDHLDRHGSMAGYIAAKERIFARQSTQDVAIIATDDEYTKALAEKYRAITVSITGRADYFAEDHVLHDVAAVREYHFKDLPHLQGVHNYQNALIAYVACLQCGFEGSAIFEAMQQFTGLAHRMEQVRIIRNVRFVNDSKATNADAAAQSLATYNNIYWIAGGVGKEGGITSLKAFFPRLAQTYLIGQSAQEFSTTLGDLPHEIYATLEEAVISAYKAAQAEAGKSVILFAPAAASFDMFANFEARGDAFKAIVNGL